MDSPILLLITDDEREAGGGEENRDSRFVGSVMTEADAPSSRLIELGGEGGLNKDAMVSAGRDRDKSEEAATSHCHAFAAVIVSVVVGTFACTKRDARGPVAVRCGGGGGVNSAASPEGRQGVAVAEGASDATTAGAAEMSEWSPVMPLQATATGGGGGSNSSFMPAPHDADRGDRCIGGESSLSS